MAGPEKIIDTVTDQALDGPAPGKEVSGKAASAKPRARKAEASGAPSSPAASKPRSTPKTAEAKAAPAKTASVKAAADERAGAKSGPAKAPSAETASPKSASSKTTPAKSRAPKAAAVPLAASPTPPQPMASEIFPEASPGAALSEVVPKASPMALPQEAFPDIPGETTPSPVEEPSPAPVDFDQLTQRMMALQQEIRKLGIPVVILLEGWDAAGKGTLLGELLEGLDPRGYQVHVMDRPNQEERRYPPFRRHWVAMPAQGHISLFVGSWYREVSNDCLGNKAARKALPSRYAQIVQLESQLVCDGVLLLKFFLNVSKKEQKARLKALESKKSTRWRVSGAAWEQNDRYEEMARLYDAMMAETDREGAPWHVLPSRDKGASKARVASLVLDAFAQAIAAYQTGERPWDVPALPQVRPVTTQPIAPLASYQTFQPLDGEYKEALDQAQKRLRKLQSELYHRQVPTVVCFEGWDAAGKGGAILRLTRGLDPRGFRVIPTAAPSPVEAAHHHLWRFWRDLPKDGHVAIFDRTWYGRVLVERVEGLCTQAQWQRAYEEINQFELELARHGTILRKFWLQIDPREQLARFQERQGDPHKQWKITQEDWRNRDKWPQYQEAVEDMLQRTHTRHAPWIVVEADNKRFARLKVLGTLIEAMEQELKK